MKRRFTILSAALALLVSLAIPMGMRGQTREAVTLQYTGSTTFTWQENTNYANQLNLTASDWSVTGQKNDATNMTACNKDGSIRLYPKSGNGSSIIVSSNNGSTISSISFVMQQNEPTVKVNGNIIEPTNGVYTINSTSFVVINGIDATSGNQVQIKSISINYEGGTPSTTYSITFDAGDGNFVGSTDFPNASNTVAAGTYTLPSAERSGYTFDGWVTGNNDPITGSYTVSGNVDFTAAYTENDTPTPGGNLNLTFNLTSNPGNWPTSASTSLTNFDYTLAGVDYTFALNNVYCNSGYLMLKSVAVLGLPAIEGYKLTTVVAHNSNGCSTSTKVGISSSATQASYIAGGAAQTWSTQGSTYTYNLTSTEENTMYYMYVTNKNAQLFSLDLIYEAVAASTIATPTFDPTSGTEFGDDGLNVSITCETNNVSIYYTLNGDTPNNQSTLYNGAISLTETTTINAIAYDGTNYSNVATATYTYVDPNAPGTENNPYTVAQARAAIDANAGTQGVYATGIVSQVDSYNNNYHSITYWISDDGTTTNQLEAYGGISGITGWTFASKDDIEVGATVVIYGNLKKFNTTYEFDVNNELVSYTAPQHAVEAPTFSPAAGTFTMAQTVTLSCATTGATIYYTLDGTEPTSASTQYTAALTISSTTTVKAIAYVGTDASTVATATYHFCSAEDPYTVTEALAFNEYPANGIYVHGIVSTAPTQSPTSNGELTYYISVDGNATNQLEVYKGKGLNQAAFTAQNDIQVGDIVTIYGNVVIFNDTKEFTTGNYLVSFERPAQEYTLTVTCSDNVEIFTFVGESTDPGVEGSTTLQVTNGTEVGLSVSVSEGYVLTLIVDDENVTSQLDETGWYEFTMPAHAVTVSATASVAPVVTTNTYTLATSIESGKQYIIVGWANGTPYAMGYQKSNNRHAVEISVTGDGNENASATIANTETNAHEFTIISLGEGFYSIEDATNSSGYLYAAGSSSNFLKTESTLSDNSRWKITVNSETGLASVVATNSSNRNVMQFNNSDKLFACYATASQHPVYLYVKDEPRTYTKDIAGWDVGEEEDAFNFYLIASPIGNVAPTAVTITSEDPDKPADVTNMVEGSYDLYYFDHNRDKEWVNYKDASGNPGAFSLLESGKGYLYANMYDVTLVFTGTGRHSGEETVELDYVSGTGIDLPGWNLLGNPFTKTAYLTTSNSSKTTSFYTMDERGNYISVTNGSIDPMEGVFVHAEGEGQSVTFTTTAPSKSPVLNLNLSNGRRVVDRAIVRFDGGDQLPKLQFREGSTKVYIPVEGQDYAVVSCEEMGELPVSFKAEENGSYNLSLSSEEVSFAYLHLIDNMTGADVDLLQTPSYSFEARTTDYANRFKLVFATGDNSNDDNFAFFSNGSFVINNDGEATLQVIDVTGRILSSESINGCANVNVNAAPGVYMLRLINGDNVKVQKVVVK